MVAGKKKPAQKNTDTPGIERTLRDDAEKQFAHSTESSPDFKGQTPEKLIHELSVHQIELEMQAEELRRAYLALEESRDKFLDLYEFAPLGYVTLNDKALVTEANLACATLLGIERSKLISAQFGKFVAQKDSDQWFLYFRNALNRDGKQICTLMLTRKDGSVFPARLEGIRINGSDGKFTVRIALSDITDIWQIRALRESEERYRTIYDQSPIAIELYDAAGVLVHVNPACLNLFGVKNMQVLMGFSLFADPNITDEQKEKLHKGETAQYQGPFDFTKVKTQNLYPTSRDGIIWLDVLITPLANHTDSVTGFLVQIQDSTERKRAEEALSQASMKLTLLSSITRHDINNQLLTLNGYLGLLQSEVPDHRHSGYFTRITTASDRIAAMIRFTKEYEAIGASTPIWQSCRTLVTTAAKQTPLGQVMVKNDLPDGTEVFADPLIVKVFYNLMDNAAQHGGKITTIRFSSLEREGVHLVVCEDDGDGIAADEKEHIFERGFGKNTGLGLTLSRDILAITGITIRETGESGKGARFEMTVPNGAWRYAGKSE